MVIQQRQQQGVTLLIILFALNSYFDFPYPVKPIFTSAMPSTFNSRDIATNSSEEFDYYSNEYDDVRPHFIFTRPKDLDEWALEYTQALLEQLKDMWQSMTEALKNGFTKLKSIFDSSDNTVTDVDYVSSEFN